MAAMLIAVWVLLAGGCGGGGGGDSTVPDDASLTDEDFANVSAFVADSPYSDVIVDCASVTSSADSCTLERLPLIGMETQSPDIDQIMDRVVVSHQWMGERFHEALEMLPGDLLLLLRNVTAVVIDDDIRPSYYTTRSGAIYLDPAKLWLTNEEKATINQKDDYRSDYDNLLAFRSLWRYVKAGSRAYSSYSLDSDKVRSLNDILLPLAALLYHELAHANDFFPLAQVELLDTSISVSEASAQVVDYRISTRLDQREPLTSSVMSGLAEVMYKGQTPSEEQMEITAAVVGEAFEADGASDDYGYTTVFEDVAMLFEEAMMKYHFDVDREMAFTTVVGDETRCADHLIGWGNHGRIGDTDVKSRAQFVASEILPGEDFSLFFQNLAYPAEMAEGNTWCGILDPAATTGARKAFGANLEIRADQSVGPDEMLRHH